MKKVMFEVEGYEEEQEYDDDVTDEEIEEDFRAWIGGRSEWWVIE